MMGQVYYIKRKQVNRMRKIKVLVVDDSMLFRNLLVQSLSEDPYIEVVAQAGDAYEARDAIL